MRMTVKTKIIGLGVGTGMMVGLTLGLYMLKLSSDAAERRVAELDRTLRGNFDRNARLEVETAVSLLKPFADRAANGEMTLE